MVIFTELEQIISQFVWKYKKPQIAKAILIRKNGTGGINLPDFRLYYKASHQDSMVLVQRQKNGSIEKKKNKTESLEIYPCTHGHLIFDKRRQEYTIEKRQSL